jgi:hypothetical protein
MDPIISILLSIPGNYIYDWLKGLGSKVDRMPWDKLYIDSHVRATKILNHYESETNKPPQMTISVEKQSLHDALHQEAQLGPLGAMGLTLSRITSATFFDLWSEAIVRHTAIIAGDLEGEDYRQQVRNVVRHANALYTTAIISSEIAYRRMDLLEGLAGRADMNKLLQDLSRRLKQSVSRDDLLPVISKLDAIEKKLEPESQLLSNLILNPDAPFITWQRARREQAQRSQTQFGVDLEPVGRKVLLQTIRSHLDAPEVRVIIVTRAFHIGKSSLVLAATAPRKGETLVVRDPLSLTMNTLLALEPIALSGRVVSNRGHLAASEVPGDFPEAGAFDREPQNILEAEGALASSRAIIEQTDDSGIAAPPATPSEVLVIIDDTDPTRARKFTEAALGQEWLKLVITLPSTERVPHLLSGSDTAVTTINVEPLTDEQSRMLLEAAEANIDFGLWSWVVHQAEGNPGVLLAAARIGEKLRSTTMSFTETIADAFRQRASEVAGEEAIRALLLLSILARVGINGLPATELDLVCKLFGDDPSSGVAPTSASVRKQITKLEQAGLVRHMGNYVEVLPPIFANSLAKEAISGRYTSLLVLIAALTPEGQRRLRSRLQALDGGEAKKLWSELLTRGGLLTDLASTLVNPAYAELLREAATVIPQTVSLLVEDALTGLSVEERRAVVKTTHWDLVLTVQELLFFEESSASALRCMVLVAEVEGNFYTAHARSEVARYFYPLHPQAPISLTGRLAMLKELLAQHSSLTIRLLAVEAIRVAFTSSGTFSLHSSKGSRPLDTQAQMTWENVWTYMDELADLLMTEAAPMLAPAQLEQEEDLSSSLVRSDRAESSNSQVANRDVGVDEAAAYRNGTQEALEDRVALSDSDSDMARVAQAARAVLPMVLAQYLVRTGRVRALHHLETVLEWTLDKGAFISVVEVSKAFQFAHDQLARLLANASHKTESNTADTGSAGEQSVEVSTEEDAAQAKVDQDHADEIASAYFNRLQRLLAGVVGLQGRLQSASFDVRLSAGLGTGQLDAVSDPPPPLKEKQ